MSDLFKYKATFNEDISNWTVSQVTNMTWMFKGAKNFNNGDAIISLSISSGSVEFNGIVHSGSGYDDNNPPSIIITPPDTSGTQAEATVTVTGGVVTGVTITNAGSGYSNSYLLFSSISTKPLTSWDVSAVKNMVGMFHLAAAFNQDISNWTVSQVTNMTLMFADTLVFNQDISSWDVSLVTNMSAMFQSAIVFNQDISEWTVSQVTNMGSIFQGAYAMIAQYPSATSVTSENWASVMCFYGFVNVMTDCGLKQIKDLKRGDMILTNDGYQPLAELDVGFNPSDKLLTTKLKSTDFMVKIPKDFFIENVPSEDVYVTKTHPLSVKITSAENTKDFEYLHLFVKELMQLGVGMEYVRKDSETKLYNLIFDNHYEINVGNMKFLSHHPNHNNGNKRLEEGKEINSSYRTKKVYADDKGIYFKIITLKRVLKRKPENMTDKEYLASVLRFD